MTPLRIAVIGYGKLGAIHTRLLVESDQFDFVGVVDPLSANRSLATETHGVNGYEYLDEILDLIDCAVVATPTVFHHDVCSILLAAGKHVLVEKPITATVQEAQCLVALAAVHRVKLQVGHVVRFDPHFQTAQNLINEPRLIECTRASGYTFRSMDVGVTLDLMIHDLDLVLALVDSPVKSLQATGCAVIGPHEDIAHARLTFENGSMANLTASRTSHTQVRSLQATGQFGHVSIDFMNNEFINFVGVGDALSALDIDPVTASDTVKQDVTQRFFTDLLPQQSVPITPCNAIQEEHRDFHRSITEDVSPIVCGTTGLRVLEVATRITETIKAGTTDEPVSARGPHFENAPSSAETAALYKSHVRGV